ncbi:phosphopantetheine-binding protein [Rhodospirillaceae bacterium SYSU D60014]|jgi:acyl carrier protein|uniref:acyl carrier protein n=1 Tax=Virgifigura deserti TaxID=2268457 RepID=UPI000E66A9BA
MASVRDETFNEISRMLDSYRKSAAPITTETDITRDLNLDSLAVMDLMMELEEKFDISIPLNLVPEIQTVGDLTATIQKIREDA